MSRSRATQVFKLGRDGIRLRSFQRCRGKDGEPQGDEDERIRL